MRCYESGDTPNPCIDCNRYMKFDKLYERARLLGCEYIATGHYARIEEYNGQYVLRKALDETKDQSYVLYSLTQEQLAHTLFPLGKYNKSEIRIFIRKVACIMERIKSLREIALADPHRNTEFFYRFYKRYSIFTEGSDILNYADAFYTAFSQR